MLHSVVYLPGYFRPPETFCLALLQAGEVVGISLAAAVEKLLTVSRGSVKEVLGAEGAAGPSFHGQGAGGDRGWKYIILSLQVCIGNATCALCKQLLRKYIFVFSYT